MNALELPQQVSELTSKYKTPSHERGVLNGASILLRRQHEAIVKLREASEWASVALDGVIDLLPKPESTECRNARRDILKALKDTEGL